jgi:hypothetical protein
MRRVLATDFGIWLTTGASETFQVSDAMLASPRHQAALANYLLLHDQVVVPTGNLLILPVLRLMLGEAVFDELIRNKEIVLARFDWWFGYAGNGAGIHFFQIGGDPKKHAHFPNFGTTFFSPLDEAVDFALKHTNPQPTEGRREELQNLLLDNIVSVPTRNIVDELTKESYKDILGSPYLRDLLALRNAGRSINHLKGLGPNQMTICAPHSPAPGMVPEIRAVLRVVFENFLLGLGGQTESTEITGDNTTLSILQAKGQRLGYSPQGNDAFAQIQQVSGVPDLGAAFAKKQITPAQLLDLRRSKHCQALRDWLAKGKATDTAEDTLRRYVESVGRPSLIESLPAKLLRFAVTTGAGVLGPVSGAAVDMVDSFFLSKWFPGKSPRLFMKQAKVILDNSPTIPKPVMRGRDRNLPCSCRSGKKYKKCCGA